MSELINNHNSLWNVFHVDKNLFTFVKKYTQVDWTNSWQKNHKQRKPNKKPVSDDSHQNSQMVLIGPLPQTPRSRSDAATQLQNPANTQTQNQLISDFWFSSILFLLIYPIIKVQCLVLNLFVLVAPQECGSLFCDHKRVCASSNKTPMEQRFVWLKLGQKLKPDLEQHMETTVRKHWGVCVCVYVCVCTSRMMKNSSPGSPWTTIFCPSSNWTGSNASATVRRSHLSRDSEQKTHTHTQKAEIQHTHTHKTPFCLLCEIFLISFIFYQFILVSAPNTSCSSVWM